MTELAVHFLDAAAVRAGRDSPADAASAIDLLEWLTTSIARDRAAGRFDDWGRSTVIDENVGKPVLARAAFEYLHELAGAEAVWPLGNAGVLHCYGYLLSRIKTPYGLKRERWLGAELAHAYGMADDGFVPWSSESTLLERAADAASGLLDSPAVSRSLIVDGRESRVALSSAAGPAALAYAVASAPDSEPLLVTTFPVAEAVAVLDEFDAEPRLHWNAA